MKAFIEMRKFLMLNGEVREYGIYRKNEQIIRKWVMYEKY